jgi:toxin YoeB
MSKILCWYVDAWEDYLYWQKHDKQMLRKVNSLIQEILRTPFSGTGKPEPLKYSLEGCWSRRINREHRIVYQVQDNIITIIQCRYHY